MKGVILETLNYPRRHIEMDLNRDECRHGGNYNENDRMCHECDNCHECHWLSENDECVALEKKSVDQLVDALEFSLDYIDSKIADWGHNVNECECESCQWLKKAEALYSRCSRL